MVKKIGALNADYNNEILFETRSGITFRYHGKYYAVEAKAIAALRPKEVDPSVLGVNNPILKSISDGVLIDENGTFCFLQFDSFDESTAAPLVCSIQKIDIAKGGAPEEVGKFDVFDMGAVADDDDLIAIDEYLA